MLPKDCVSVIRFSNIMQCENQAEAIESCGEKCTNLCRVYKLIMISRVPGYGQLEYLVLEYHCESQHVTSNKSYWVLMSTFNWD